MPADDLELDHPTGIASLLSEAVQSQQRLTLSSPGGEALALLPSRLDSASGGLLLRLPGLQVEAPDWLMKGPVHAQVLLDKVRIDFELDEARQLLLDDGLPALRIGLPARIRRHQRRQAFRVAPLSQHHPRAVLPVAGEARPLRLVTQDLSAGGVALRWPTSRALPSLEARLDGVELELERELRIGVNLIVEHVRQDARGDWVVGCAFRDLAPQAERQLLLHLNQMQRRHRVVASR